MSETNHNPGSRLMEATNAELVEAAERMDAGMRLVVPMMFETPGSHFDGLGADPAPGQTEHLSIEEAPVTLVPEPEVDEELLADVAGDVAEFRDKAFRRLRHLDKNAPRHVYIEYLAIVAQLDDFLTTVREYVGAEGRS